MSKKSLFVIIFIQAEIIKLTLIVIYSESSRLIYEISLNGLFELVAQYLQKFKAMSEYHKDFDVLKTNVP